MYPYTGYSRPCGQILEYYRALLLVCCSDLLQILFGENSRNEFLLSPPASALWISLSE